MSIDLKRIKSFKQWSTDKMLVIHMETPFLDVETCLKMTGIPFKSILYNSSDFLELFNKGIKESIGIIITGSRKKGKELPHLNIGINDLPMLGMCYGNEWLAYYLGCNIVDCNHPIGEHSEVEAILYNSLLFNGISDKETIVTMAHDYMIGELGPGCEKIASTNLTPIAGFQNIERGIFGLQFHPEKGYLGEIIFRNFYRFCLKSKYHL
ncbi:MAG: hypothetical protein EBS19_05600 [Spirochaetia bacterium]|nr:hypothetical protein [Spirochaetia bacterium]NBX71750.1 hypothetical protein [bacterium]